MLYCSWDMVCDRCNLYFFYFKLFFPFLPPSQRKKENLRKMKKIAGDIIIYRVYQKIWSHNVQFLRYAAWQVGAEMDLQMNRWTDGQMDEKITHMWRRRGTRQNCFLVLKLLKWANKKQNNFDIYNVDFFLKKKNNKKHL